MGFCTYCRNYKRVEDEVIEVEDPAYCLYPDGYCECEVGGDDE